MEFEENNVASEIMGIEEILERYTNPANKEMYMNLFSIFIEKEEMDIFTSVSEILSNEEQVESGDITSILQGLIKRSAIAVLKNTYGIILTEELEVRVLDLYDILIKLKFLVNLDLARADKFASIIDDREEDLEAYAEILIDLGVDTGFIYNYIIEIEYDFLDAYAKILKQEKENTVNEDDDLADILKLEVTIGCLTKVLVESKSELLNLSIARNSYLKESDVLGILNGDLFKKDNLPVELLSAYRLLSSDSSLSEFYKDYTENIEFSTIEENEEYYVLFKDLDFKYKIELAKRMSNE